MLSSVMMQEEVFEAEIVPDSADNTLNITLAATFAVSVIFLFLGSSVGHILEEEPFIKSAPNWWEVPIHERHKMNNLNLTQERSLLPIEGKIEVRTYTEHYIPVELPASEDDVGIPEDDLMH